MGKTERHEEQRKDRQNEIGLGEFENILQFPDSSSSITTPHKISGTKIDELSIPNGREQSLMNRMEEWRL